MSLESLRNFKSSNRHLLCLEINPPRGSDCTAILERLEGKLKGVDYFNVTDSALAKMRMSGIAFASILKQRFGIEPLVNFSCRDRNVISIQSDLLGGWALNIRSIIALTGDAVSIGDMPEAKGVFEVNSIGLLNIIEKLRSGKDLAENDLHGKTDYTAGAVVNPNVKNINPELKRLKRKMESGAKYALSQPVFDEENSYNFFKAASEIGINIFMGLLAFKSGKSALALSKIPGIKLPQNIIEIAEKSPDMDMSSFSLDHCLKLAKANKEFVQGYHVVSGATPKLALQLTERLADYIKSETI